MVSSALGLRACLSILCLGLAGFGEVARGQDALLPADALADMRHWVEMTGAGANSLVPVSGAAFTRSAQSEVWVAPPAAARNYGVQISFITTGAIASNDVLHASFWARV